MKTNYKTPEEMQAEWARKSSNGHSWGIAILITVVIIGTMFYFMLDRAQKITAADEFYTAHGCYEKGTPDYYKQVGRLTCR